MKNRPGGQAGGVGVAAAAAADTSKRRTYVRRILLALLVGALLYGLATIADEVGPAARALGRADLLAVVLAAGCEAISYVALGAVLRRLAARDEVTHGRAIRIGLIAMGLGTILPAAPVEGTVLAARELEEHGVSRRRTFTAIALAQWYVARAVFAVAAEAALVLAAFSAFHSRSERAWILLGGGLACTFAFVAMGVIASRAGRLAGVVERVRRFPVLGARAERIAAWSVKWSREINAAIGERSNKKWLLLLAVSATSADAGCFVLALRATDVHVAPRVLVLAYAIAMMSAFIPLLPAGIGVAEASVPAFLHTAHVPITTALAGILVYRGLATLMPAVAGVGVLGELRLRRRNRAAVSPRSRRGP